MSGQLGTAEAGNLSFSDALNHMKAGIRMSARFMPDNIFITIQKPDAGSMNTEPYLKMVVVDPPKDEGGDFGIKSCEPWEPGRRSLFSNEWYTSKYQK